MKTKKLFLRNVFLHKFLLIFAAAFSLLLTAVVAHAREEPIRTSLPNLFPSWLGNAHTPTYQPVTIQVPYIQTAYERTYGPYSLKSPSHGSTVSCSSDLVGSLPKHIASSSYGLFGGPNSFTEIPCQPFLNMTCPSPTTNERVATATANAYIALNAFWDFFAGLGWRGFDNSGSPIGIEFGSPQMLWAGSGWHDASKTTIYCPGSVLHIDHHTHELAHGVVSATTNFLYNYSGSGGTVARILNEAIADFFAEMIQFHADIPETSWNPNSSGDYIVTTSETSVSASGNFFAPTRGCHSDPMANGSDAIYVNGGPVRHAMYLLAEGTDPVNLPHSEPCIGPNTFPGIGREKTAKIWLDALAQCDWRADGNTIDFCDARRCTLEVASCPDRNKVANAWYAVELTAGACGISSEQLCPLTPTDDTPLVF